MKTDLRQWCPVCEAVTPTWVDNEQIQRCGGCDPESKTHPGRGVRDDE